MSEGAVSDSGCWHQKGGWDVFTTMARQVSQADKDGTNNSQTENQVVHRYVKSKSLPHAAVVGAPRVPGEPRKARSRDAWRALSVPPKQVAARCRARHETSATSRVERERGSRNDNVGAAHAQRSTTRRNDVRAVGRL